MCLATREKRFTRQVDIHELFSIRQSNGKYSNRKWMTIFLRVELLQSNVVQLQQPNSASPGRLGREVDDRDKNCFFFGATCWYFLEVNSEKTKRGQMLGRETSFKNVLCSDLNYWYKYTLSSSSLFLFFSLLKRKIRSNFVHTSRKIAKRTETRTVFFLARRVDIF